MRVYGRHLCVLACVCTHAYICECIPIPACVSEGVHWWCLYLCICACSYVDICVNVSWMRSSRDRVSEHGLSTEAMAGSRGAMQTPAACCLTAVAALHPHLLNFTNKKKFSEGQHWLWSSH